MPKTLQVRNFPDDLHAELVRRARKRGSSLTRMVKEMLERELSRPDPEEVFARIRSHEPVRLDRPVSEIIRELRDKRDEHLARVLAGDDT